MNRPLPARPTRPVRVRPADRRRAPVPANRPTPAAPSSRPGRTPPANRRQTDRPAAPRGCSGRHPPANRCRTPMPADPRGRPARRPSAFPRPCRTPAIPLLTTGPTRPIRHPTPAPSPRGSPPLVCSDSARSDPGPLHGIPARQTPGRRGRPARRPSAFPRPCRTPAIPLLTTGPTRPIRHPTPAPSPVRSLAVVCSDPARSDPGYGIPARQTPGRRQAHRPSPPGRTAARGNWTARRWRCPSASPGTGRVAGWWRRAGWRWGRCWSWCSAAGVRWCGREGGRRSWWVARCCRTRRAGYSMRTGARTTDRVPGRSVRVGPRHRAPGRRAP
ncbi:hypothetical protein B0E53_05472 [Micromonospora sp. MH33]|nr:hypothetical protein B0E53_05472 [Micromonospora sp. MH33]